MVFSSIGLDLFQFGMVFSSISKGRCFGLGVGVVLVWICFFHSLTPYSLLSLPEIIFSSIGLDLFQFGMVFSSNSKVGALVWIGVVLVLVWVWLFRSLTPYSPLSLSGMIFYQFK